MSIRTTVTLDDDLVARLKQESRAKAVSFRKLLNDTIRSGLDSMPKRPTQRPFRTLATSMGVRPGLNYDCTAELLEQIEGPLHR